MPANRTSVLVGVILAVIAPWTSPTAAAQSGFAESAVVFTDFGGTADGADALALQRDGKIVLAGSSNQNQLVFALARYLDDGTLDRSFGNGGKVLTPLGSTNPIRHAVSHAVAVQRDGKIVAAGEISDQGYYDFALVRYNSDGSLDPTFDLDGVETLDFGGASDVAFSIVIQPDDKILVSGLSFPNPEVGTPSRFALVRYNPDGMLDYTFGGNGIVTTDIGPGNDFGGDVALQEDGNILVAGISFNGHDDDIALARYLPSGLLDPSFGTNGVVTTDFDGQENRGGHMTLQADGKIVVTATTNQSANNLLLLRYRSDGTLDASFGDDGRVVADLSGGTAAVQPDGKIVVAGQRSWFGVPQVAAARFNADGTIDSSFGVDGVSVINIGTTFAHGRAVLVQKDGSILVAGSANRGQDADFALFRFGSDGTVVSVAAPSSELPKTTVLGQNYPNPFNPTTTIPFELPAAGEVRLVVYDVLGRTMATLASGVWPAGRHTVTFDAGELPSGVYVYTLQTRDLSATRTLVVQQ